MAVKRSMSKKKPAIKREIKRAPAQAVTNLDIEAEVPPMDPMATEADFMQAPLTPEQQAEKDALDGSNAAATANNSTIPEQQKVEMNASSFKTTVAYKELMALPVEERRKLIEEDQKKQKVKLKVK